MCVFVFRRSFDFSRNKLIFQIPEFWVRFLLLGSGTASSASWLWGSQRNSNKGPNISQVYSHTYSLAFLPPSQSLRFSPVLLIFVNKFPETVCQ